MSSYADIMDDHDYDADAREEAFGELCDTLTNLATAIASPGSPA